VWRKPTIFWPHAQSYDLNLAISTYYYYKEKEKNVGFASFFFSLKMAKISPDKKNAD